MVTQRERERERVRVRVRERSSERGIQEREKSFKRVFYYSRESIRDDEKYKKKKKRKKEIYTRRGTYGDR